jgi:uncharacterized protein (TIGR00369 family)
MQANATHFARMLGIEAAVDADGQPVSQMRPGETAFGRPGVLHGGAVASLIEHGGRVALAHALGRETKFKLASMTVDFLRAGPDTLCRARGRIVRLGGRVANISVEAWADDPAKPFAAARLTFLIGS